MKRFLFLLSLAALVAFVAGACKPKNPPAPETKPAVEQPQPTKPEPPKVEEKPVKKTLQEVQFQTVYFDFDKYNLRPDAKSGLDSNYQLLKTFPDVVVKIEGHCDEKGTVEYNLSLGQKRAQSAQDYLTGLGIAANRISTISYGKERPAVQGNDEAAWSKNRRCEFRIISQ
jgi:peptidoglycan-associated lipoprotein